MRTSRAPVEITPHSPSRISHMAVGLAVLAGLAAPHGLLATGSSTVPMSSPLPQVRVVPANTFVDGVGINVHMSYSDTAYANSQRVTSLLQDLGVRHVRDAVVPGRPDQWAALKTLADRGITSSLVLWGPGSSRSTTLPTSVSAPLVGPLRGTYDSLEDPNEYDCSGDPGWPTTLRAYSESVARSLQASPITNSVPLLGPSFCRPGSDDLYGALGPTGSIANRHAYPSGQAPEMTIEATLAHTLNTARTPTTVVTETGYQDSGTDGSSQPRTAAADVADYIPRLLLDNARTGVARTYIYELLDEKPDPGARDPEEHFGLVRNDGSVKPSYTALRTLLRGIGAGTLDPSRPATGGSSIGMAVDGGGALVRFIVLGDAVGGGRTVAIWLADTRTDPRSHAQIPDTWATVGLRFDRTYAASVSQPSRGGASRALGSAARFILPVNGAVSLLRLEPTSGRAAALPRTVRTYQSAQRADGAIATDGLSAVSSGAVRWAERPAADDTSPIGRGSGISITGPGQVGRLAVPGTSTAWTLELWSKTTSGSVSGSVFARVPGARGALLRTYDLTADPNTHQQLSVYGLPPAGAPPAAYGSEMFAQAALDSWHHLALVSTGAEIRFYVDGILRGRSASGPTSVSTLEFGSVSSGWRGSLAGLGIYGRALSPAAVLAHATAPG